MVALLVRPVLKKPTLPRPSMNRSAVIETTF
jgi:hypothetical protein